MDKEVKIVPPEGYEIDKENSTFECIKFKPIIKRWRDDKYTLIDGYFIGHDSNIVKVNTDGVYNKENNYNVFATAKQAKSALAMARISQIMANDERFGGVVTNKEWSNPSNKYCISKFDNKVNIHNSAYSYNFLAFHTAEQRDLFLEENADLIKDYLML